MRISTKPKVTSSAGWREIGGKRKYYRSSWEANFARFLQWSLEQNLYKSWEHEPQTFWFLKILRGTRSYLPDFKITKLDGTHFWVEVKGYMDAKSKTKLKRMAKYYPDEEVRLIDKKWFQQNQNFKLIIKDWET